MEQEKRAVDAMTMTEENPFYVKYLKAKPKMIEERDKRLLRKASRKKQTVNKDFTSAASEEALEDENIYLFLSFITKKYFRDNVLFSLLKLALAVGAIVLAILMEDVIPVASQIKGFMMVAFFSYGLIMTPLAVLYVICNWICLLRYSRYITTTSSIMARRIINFYDPETDKMMAVNFRNTFKARRSFVQERKRMRGW